MQRSSVSDSKVVVFLFIHLILTDILGHMSDFMNLLGSTNWRRHMLSVISASQ